MDVLYRDSVGDTYIHAAKRCGEVIWQRGVLATKGPGLCHGLGGSICALIDLFNATDDEKWLHRATTMGAVLLELLPTLRGHADREYSLFEGFGGAVYALGLVKTLHEGGKEAMFHRDTTCFPGLAI
jgi:lantibiotic modifying enzyme